MYFVIFKLALLLALLSDSMIYAANSLLLASDSVPRGSDLLVQACRANGQDGSFDWLSITLSGMSVCSEEYFLQIRVKVNVLSVVF